MFLPLGDDQVAGGHRPYFAYGFIALNVAIFIYQVTLVPQMQVDFVNEYGSIPAEIQAGEDYYTLLSSMFLHGGWMHLIGNMLYLWIFADNIEATVGSGVFLIFYLLGGLAAHFGHIYFNPGSVIPTVGASGALSAVMGAYLVMFPKSRIRGYLFFFRITIPAIFFLLFWFAQQAFSGYASLGPETSMAQGGGVAWWAHIGGFVFGVIGGFWFKSNYVMPKVG
ncbi:rhomboid family intramembrane serine protease [Lewinellaceae bacterium SD302]|nr:rhomboid family intramembrane serine protease [Lewinellaceae bacterium SD302]